VMWFVSKRQRNSLLTLMFIKNICPTSFDAFDYIPSVGASGGTIVIWKSSLFSSTTIFHNEFCMSIEFTLMHNNDSWILSNIYAPCVATEKRIFLN